jgi:hypothetical protein
MRASLDFLSGCEVHVMILSDSQHFLPPESEFIFAILPVSFVDFPSFLRQEPTVLFDANDYLFQPCPQLLTP